ncbi:hypothetical protein ACIP1U_27320 [Cupriavidus sp. NPDC089707]|uniref:hypothetical protein n=1 Tax=Cupriavidus sp. NPDC089707 TaxID=3363963 RepID=UPI00382F406D
MAARLDAILAIEKASRLNAFPDVWATISGGTSDIGVHVSQTLEQFQLRLQRTC